VRQVRGGVQPQVGQPPGEVFKRDLGLQPGERRDDTVVDTPAERQVRSLASPVQPPAVGVREKGSGSDQHTARHRDGSDSSCRMMFPKPLANVSCPPMMKACAWSATWNRDSWGAPPK
jgi:hypothetical protein